MYENETPKLEGSIVAELEVARVRLRAITVAMADVIAYFLGLGLGLTVVSRARKDSLSSNYPYFNSVTLGRPNHCEVLIYALDNDPELLRSHECMFFDRETTSVAWERRMDITCMSDVPEIKAAAVAAQKRFKLEVEFANADLVYLSLPSWVRQGSARCRHEDCRTPEGVWVRRAEAVELIDTYVASLKDSIKKKRPSKQTRRES